uniref:arf-GAP with dual PH domain-containing protein 1-like isoform X1 n=1 Tax=Myxine glutinosa TaxID=7769 RepID=UPI00358E55A1
MFVATHNGPQFVCGQAPPVDGPMGQRGTYAIQVMERMGNKAAKDKYEKFVPPFYYRPTMDDCTVLREQWIYAKYQRQEFMSVDKQEAYTSGFLEGLLWKRGRDNGQFLQRRFVLSEKEGMLKYFTKMEQGREPKCVIKICEINATFQPHKIGNQNGLQITHLRDGITRNIFVFHQEGKVIVDWYNAIRAARFHYLQVAFPGAQDQDLVKKLTRTYAIEGYMEKSGPRPHESFKRRWCTLDTMDRRLMYFKDPLDAYPKGEVFIGSMDSGYSVHTELPPGIQNSRLPHGLAICTPERNFVFACESLSQLKEWVAALEDVIKRPMSPQDYAAEARFVHKR